jgi:hypothetical protein
MAHNISVSENPNGTRNAIGCLTIVSTPQSHPYGQPRELRVSAVRGGLRFKTEQGPGVHVHGEDLYALREMIEELDDELFVKPADPIEVKDFWSPGDSVFDVGGNTFFALGANGKWTSTRDGKINEYVGDTNRGGFHYHLGNILRQSVEAGDHGFIVTRRANA